MKIILLPLFVCLIAVEAQNEVSPNTSEPILPTPSYDYVVQVVYRIDETKLPAFLINWIYQNFSVEIPTKDSLSLFKINNASINSTSTILSVLGKRQEEVFSVPGLEATLKIARLNFTDFYSTLTSLLGLSGTSLRNALETLGIDSGNFSAGITFGEPDPWQEFKKGNFSKQTLEAACNITSVTLDKLFEGARDIVLRSISNLNQRNFVQLILSQGVTRPKALELWNILNVTTKDVYNVEFFRNKISAIRQRLHSYLTLGVVTPIANITINKKTYDLWKNDKELISVNGTNSKGTYLVTRFVENVYQNIVVLSSTQTIPNIENIAIGSTSDMLRNCLYITIENNKTVPKFVQNVTKLENGNGIEISLINTTELILGSPLICENKVYGLAREISNDSKVIKLDTFETTYHSGKASLNINNVLFVVIVTSFLFSLV